MKITGIHHVTLLVTDLARADWFYGEVLELPKKRRPSFDFPGLFYLTGDRQEIHIILSSRPTDMEPLYFRRGGGEEITLRHVHRHAALRVSDIESLEQRLNQHDVQILFSESVANPDDEFAQNLIAGWRVAYNGVPVFCEDPFRNLLEFVPLP